MTYREASNYQSNSTNLKRQASSRPLCKICLYQIFNQELEVYLCKAPKWKKKIKSYKVEILINGSATQTITIFWVDRKLFILKTNLELESKQASVREVS